MVDSVYTIFGYELLVPIYAKQLGASALFGFVIGLEREWKQKSASIKTFALICVGSCLFTNLSIKAAAGSLDNMPYDVTRIAAGIVTGIGFLGGGVIFKTADRIEGITTGAMIWFVAALGMACGFNEVYFAVWSFIVYLFIFMLSSPVYNLVEHLRDEIVANSRTIKAMRLRRERKARDRERKNKKMEQSLTATKQLLLILSLSCALASMPTDVLADSPKKDRTKPISAVDLLRYNLCVNDRDCIVANNGCCDCANGGEDVAINKNAAERFKGLFDCDRTPCTLRAAVPACGSGVVSCIEGRCHYIAENEFSEQEGSNSGTKRSTIQDKSESKEQ